MPRVSIITPTYNPRGEDYLISQRSIEEQTNRDFEWIIVDDGSDSYNNWAEIRLNRNYGASVARNLGFQVSTGDIITYLDMGDELNPKRVENLIKIFDDNQINILFSAYYIQNTDKRAILYNHFNQISTPRFPDAFEYLKLLQRQNITIPLGVAHSRKPFVVSGGFQRGIVCGEDGILWRRMVDCTPNNKIMFSDDIAGTYFITEGSQSKTQRRPEMGGFAFDGERNDNGKYLDNDWFEEFTSNGYFE